MFVIFGWEKTVKPLETLLTTDCRRCQNHARWNIWQQTEWVSLFFIRLLPFKSRYYLACGICSDAVELSEKTCKRARNHRRLSPAKSRDVYDQLIGEIEDHQYAGMTEGQRQYYKNS